MPRKHVSDDKVAKLDKTLRGMFKALQNRPIPSRLRSVVDQLDDGESDQDKLKKSG